MSCTYTSMYIILFGLNIFCKGLNWFYYILLKASDLRCQQVIFSKSQVKSQVMDSKSKSSTKSMREVASQVTSHKNGDSSQTRVQVTWLKFTSLTFSTSHKNCDSSQTRVQVTWLKFTSLTFSYQIKGLYCYSYLFWSLVSQYKKQTNKQTNISLKQ